MDEAASSETEQAWRAAVAAALKGATLDPAANRTRDGIAIAPLYGAANAPPLPWRDAGRSVGIVARVDHPDAAAANALALADVQGGATGLALVGSGHPAAQGFGLPAPALGDMLDGLWLSGLALRLDLADADRAGAVDTLLAQAARQGFGPDGLDLDLGLDPCGDPATVRGHVAAFRERGLAGPVLRADGRPHHDAGASEAQELAAVLSAGVAGLRAAEPLGLEVARGALGFALGADADQLLTIAKLRAMRRLWATVEAGCGLAPRPIRIHVQTSWRMLARADAHTNILRTALATAAAILGGADSITALPFTSALGLPDALARRLARNTPLVLLEEAHLGRVADPAAGAGAFESMTEALCAEAWRRFQELEREGGLAAALRTGEWQRAVTAMGDARHAALAGGTATLVGVTQFVPADVDDPVVLRPAGPVMDASGTGLRPRRDAEPFEVGAQHPASGVRA